jgi:hypothetical protein
MDDFAKFFNQKQHRHRGNGFTDVHKTYRRKQLNLVPDTFKKDLSKNQKIENLKDNSGTTVCNKADLDYIRKTYSIVPHADKEQMLGKTGVKLYYCPKTKTFMLTK